MKFKDLSQKTKEDLAKIQKETTLELMKERAQVATGTTPKSPGKLKTLRKTLAKIKQING